MDPVEEKKDSGQGSRAPLIPSVRPSGYLSRSEEIWYGMSGPFYDLLTWWCFLPLGGEKACRKEFVSWFDAEPGQKVLSLCCGTGTTERALVEAVPSAGVTAMDLGTGQVETAKRKDRAGRIDFRVGDASDTGMRANMFDRVLIILALHEMPRDRRRVVLKEAARVCRPGGRVIAIEHALPTRIWMRLSRAFWWFSWLPGNPEIKTTWDLQRNGLAHEMGQTGLKFVRRHTTTPAWIEGVVAEPVS